MTDRDLTALLTNLREFARERDWEQFHSPKNLAMALSVEAAEIMEHFQWMTEEESKNLNPEKKIQVGTEVGDVLIYLLRLADVLGIDPSKAAWDKLEDNRKKYPADRVRGSSLKYDGYDR